MPQMYPPAGQRGAVRDPQSDGRLRHNRGTGIAKTAAARAEAKRGGQGRVKDPGKDRRLKHNRYSSSLGQSETSPAS